MTTKRKLTVNSMDESVPSRGGRRLSFLQANLPKLGLLWGTEGSVDKLLDRNSDVGDLCLALEQYDDIGNPLSWPEEKLEDALAQLFDKCSDHLQHVSLETAAVEEFFLQVRTNVPWAAHLSVGIIMEVCLKLMVARRAYRGSVRKFHRTFPRTRRSLLGSKIDHFDRALDPGVAATWLETFIVPVEGEQADDEMDDPMEPPNKTQPATPMRNTEEQRRQKRRMTMDQQHAPHTPPRLLRPDTVRSMVRGGCAKMGHFAPMKTTRRRDWRRSQVAPGSPSKPRSRATSSDTDIEMLVGNLVRMAIEDHDDENRDKDEDMT